MTAARQKHQLREKMKLWLDDFRDPKKFGCRGWDWAKTAESAIEYLRTGFVTEASLDHDLGLDDDCGSGYDVICWLEAHPEYWPSNGVRVHSSNPVGRQIMEVVIQKHYDGKILNRETAGINRRHGHTETCLFGTKNSGMCDCGKGFTKC